MNNSIFVLGDNLLHGISEVVFWLFSGFILWSTELADLPTLPVRQLDETKEQLNSPMRHVTHFDERQTVMGFHVVCVNSTHAGKWYGW